MDFDKAIEFELEHEGGYVNDPDDPGAETNFGISKKAYPALDIKTLTREQAIEIYRRDYWLGAGCDKLTPECLRLVHFNTAVNCGVSKAIEFASKARSSLDSYMWLVMMHYVSLTQKNPNLRKFIAGWAQRLADVFVATSKEMIRK